MALEDFLKGDFYAPASRASDPRTSFRRSVMNQIEKAKSGEETGAWWKDSLNSGTIKFSLKWNGSVVPIKLNNETVQVVVQDMKGVEGALNEILAAVDAGAFDAELDKIRDKKKSSKN